MPLPGYFTPGQWQHAIDDAGLDAILTDDVAAVLERLPGWGVAGFSGRSGLTLLRRRIAGHGRQALPRGTQKVTYTSGSTAAPKGVCLGATQLETVAASLAGATAGLAIDRHLCLLPLATLLENVGGVYAPLLAGARCVLPSLATTGIGYGSLDPERLLRVIATRRPGSLILVPELLRLLVTAAERGWRVPESLRFVAVGGAAVAPELLERAAAVGLPAFEGYGLSECASVVTLNTPGALRPGSAGRALPHARLRVAADGELHVAGVTMHGYLGEPARTPGAEYATGDLGSIDEDGYVYVRGRRRNVFISSLGRNVSPEWVERELLQQAAVAQAVVHGEARPFAVALLVAAHATVGPADLQRAVAAANAALPDYARVRRWAVVSEPFSTADGLLTANGRPRRERILERYAPLLDSLYLDARAS